jgi:hypothetical protein
MLDHRKEVTIGIGPTFHDLGKRLWAEIAPGQGIPASMHPTVNGRIAVWNDIFVDWAGDNGVVRFKCYPLPGGAKPTKEGLAKLLRAHGDPEDKVDLRLSTLLSEAGGLGAFKEVFDHDDEAERWKAAKAVATRAGVRLAPKAEGGRARSNPPAAERSTSGGPGGGVATEANQDRRDVVIGILDKHPLRGTRVLPWVPTRQFSRRSGPRRSLPTRTMGLWCCVRPCSPKHMLHQEILYVLQLSL